MRRLLKFLAQLYPTDWRKRYGVEYEALLEQSTPRARDAFDVLCSAVNMHLTGWDLRRIVFPCAIAGALLATAISFAVPARYVSETVISVTTGPADSSDGPIAPDANVTLRNLMDESLTDASLAAIIQKLDLYPRENLDMSQEDVIHRMRRGIDLRPLARGSGQTAFALRFSDPDPHVAQRVDTELVSVTMASFFHLHPTTTPSPPNTHEVFRVQHAPNLPLVPSSPKRGIFGAGGLFAGIAGGLIIAAITRRHRKMEPAG
jgi:hypothetical protein